MNKFLRMAFTVAMVSAVSVSTLVQQTKAASPVTIRIFVGLGGGAQPGDKEKQDAVAKLWNDANPDIQIAFDVNNNTTARDVLLTQIAGNNPPDIIGPVGIRGTYEVPGLYADLTPYITKDKAALKLDEYDASTLKLFEDAGGKNASLALGIYPSVLLVNEDMFKAAEVPLPPKKWGDMYTDKSGKQVVWDWDELAKVAQQITSDKNGKYGDEEGFDPTSIVNYGFNNAFVQPRNFAAAWSPTDSGVAADGKTATFDQPTYVKAFTWLHDAIYKNHFFPDTAAMGVINAGGTTPFESGKIGMWYSQVWYVNCCTSKAKFAWSDYAGPAVPGTNGKTIVSPLHADTFLLAAKSQNKDAAWTVLKWLNSADIASKLCGIYGCMPARKTARAQWEEAMKKQFSNVDVKLYYDAVQYLDHPSNESALPNYPQAADAIQAFYNSLQSDPNLDVAKGLAETNKVIQGIYQGKFPPTPTPEPTMEATAAK